MSKPDWARKAHRTIVTNPWLTIHSSDFVLPSGRDLDGFISLRERPGVNILPVTEAGEVIIVRQYRPAVGSVVIDFPGGFLEDRDDSPEDRAREELREETGYICQALLTTGRVHASPQRSNKTDETFLALGCTREGPSRLDDTEDVEMDLISLPELGRMVRRGSFNCSVCLASLLLARIAMPDAFLGF